MQPTLNLMEHFFELPVDYQERQLLLKGRLVTFAYTYKFYIMAAGTELMFEMDEDRKFRVLATNGHDGKDPDPELLQAILRTLEQVRPD